MKANRKTMLGVALAVAIIALAGVGYAAVTYNGYNATTSSSDNEITPEYVIIKLTHEGTDDDAEMNVDDVLYSGLSLPIEYNTRTSYTTSLVKEWKMKSTEALEMQFKFEFEASDSVDPQDMFELKVEGLTWTAVPGGVVSWSFQSAVTTNATQATATGTIDDLGDVVLTLRITPATGAAEWSTTDPANSIPVGNYGDVDGTLKFTLTHGEVSS